MEMIYFNILREYMDLEYSKYEYTHMKYNLKNIVNDFVLICTFIGNDFLPRMLNIRKGELEILINGFKSFLINAPEPINLFGKINGNMLIYFIYFVIKQHRNKEIL